jgi:hypothetical protein
MGKLKYSGTELMVYAIIRFTLWSSRLRGLRSGRWVSDFRRNILTPFSRQTYLEEEGSVFLQNVNTPLPHWLILCHIYPLLGNGQLVSNNTMAVARHQSRLQQWKNRGMAFSAGQYREVLIEIISWTGFQFVKRPCSSRVERDSVPSESRLGSSSC